MTRVKKPEPAFKGAKQLLDYALAEAERKYESGEYNCDQYAYACHKAMGEWRKAYDKFCKEVGL